MGWNLKALQERVISAAILIPVVLLAVAWGGGPFYLMIGAFVLISIYEWVSMVRRVEHFVPYMALGLVYLALGFGACVFIREQFPLRVGVLFLVMVWSADIAAYFVGKTFGKAKLAPQISPNKTWVGLGGACDFAGGAAMLYYLAQVFYFASESDFSWLGLIMMYLLGALIALAGQAGDLMVSFVKRRAGLKDTGALIPGHGGLLDRIDSMLLAAPVFLVLVLFFPFDV
ncbi:MAG: phosphatidate cytidylyltransferase [Rhodospirillales bacterium]|nr:phosphatidate cytidylyltransferase [Rhodospirillales bacterium]